MTLAFLIVWSMLIGASWSDLRTRRVRNQYWWPFVAIAALLWASSPGPRPLVQAAGAAAMTLLAYLLWRLGTFGGADAKALMVFAWLWPGVPDLLEGRTVPVLDTLVNATLVALALPVVFLLVNLLRGDVRFPAALLGTRMPLQRARARHVWPMQQVAWRYDEGALETPVAMPVTPPVAADPATASAHTASLPPMTGPETPPGAHPGMTSDARPDHGADPGLASRHTGPVYPPLPDRPAGPPPAVEGPPPMRWRYWHRAGDDVDAVYDSLHAAGVERVWVTPKIPFMVPLAAAAVATWAWGNLVLRLMAQG